MSQIRDRYQQAFESLFSRVSEDLQKQITAAKSPDVVANKDVRDFVRAVVALAESDAPIKPPKEEQKPLVAPKEA